MSKYFGEDLVVVDCFLCKYKTDMFQYQDYLAPSANFCDLKPYWHLRFKFVANVLAGALVDIIVVTPSAARWRQRCSTALLTQIWKKPNVKDYGDKPRESTWHSKFTKYSLVKAGLIKKILEQFRGTWEPGQANYIGKVSITKYFV